MLSSNVDGVGGSERSFDFSKFPTLQEVDFGVGWLGGDILWIPTALSTLKPATSPRISAIRFDFDSDSSTSRSTEASLLIDAGSGLRWVANEFTRIEREFEGAVNLTVVRNPGPKAVFDTLNVRFRFCRGNGARRTDRFTSCRYFRITLVEMSSADAHPVCLFQPVIFWR